MSTARPRRPTPSAEPSARRFSARGRRSPGPDGAAPGVEIAGLSVRRSTLPGVTQPDPDGTTAPAAAGADAAEARGWAAAGSPGEGRSDVGASGVGASGVAASGVGSSGVGALDVEPSSVGPSSVEPSDGEPSSVGPSDDEPVGVERSDDEPVGVELPDVGPIDVLLTWSAMRRGGGDPTYARRPGERSVWKAWQTPHGPVTVCVRQSDPGAPVRARAWGPGAAWVVARLPAMVGAGDDPGGFEPRHDVVVAAWRRFPGLRVPTTGLVIEALVPSIIEQRVTGAEAFTSYRRLVRRFGSNAPGPAGEHGLCVAPTARQWARVPSWAWLRAGVDPARSDTVMRAMPHAAALEACVGLSSAAARARLMSVRGIGVWTAAEVAHIALGDADAVSFGDYHVAKDIGVALTGAEVDDVGLEQILQPYVGHRYRVQRLVELAGLRRERHGARRSLPTHLPTRW